jgi:hypothetical protein
VTSLSKLGRAFARFVPRLCASVLVVAAAVSHAQASTRDVTPTSPYATRAQLTHMLDSLQQLDAAGGSTSKRGRKVTHAGDIAALKSRLTDGDFQVGDRFVLDDGVKRDTILVHDSVTIAVGNWPSYSLHGVLRSELQGSVERYLGTYIREPRIRVYPLTRLLFTGGFQRVGALTVDPTRPLTDAMNMTGGVNPQVKHPDRIVVYRGDKRILDEKQVADALRSGETLDDLHLQSGDEIRAPAAKQQSYRIPPYQMVLFSVSAIGAILALIRASYVP